MSNIFLSFNGDIKKSIEIMTSTHMYKFLTKEITVPSDNIIDGQFSIKNRSNNSIYGSLFKVNNQNGINNETKSTLIEKLTRIDINNNSRIYIEAHGSIQDDYLTQRLLILNAEDNQPDYVNNLITAQDIADILTKSTVCRSGIGIYIIACNSVRFASNLMQILVDNGFKDIYCVGFCSKIIISSNNLLKHEKNLNLQISYEEEENLFDNKIVCFNKHFDNMIESIPYQIYKEKYLKNHPVGDRCDIENIKCLLILKLNIIDILSRINNILIDDIISISKQPVSKFNDFFTKIINFLKKNRDYVFVYKKYIIINLLEAFVLLNTKQKEDIYVLKPIIYSTNKKYICSYFEQLLFPDID